jgi:hypothetical protein
MTTPDPAGIATNLTDGVGNAVVDLAVDLAPVTVPFVLAMGAIAWVMHKFGLNDRIELARLDRDAHAAEIAKYERSQRARARKAAKWDAMLDDAYAENRRRNLRKKVRGSYS